MTARERLAAIVHRLGDFDDTVVGKALEEMDVILESERLSWHDVATWLNEKPAAPSRNGPALPAPGPVRRQPSQWMTDKQDVAKAYAAREDADNWTAEFIESLYDQVVHKGFKLSEKQRTVLDEKMDKLGI